jgi:D-amino-acid oxidase
MNKQNVLILGKGVSGLTTALQLLRSGHQVTIWAKEPCGQHPHTSLKAYAMWVPVTIAGDARVERWTDETYIELEKLSHQAGTGVVMRQIFVLKQHYDEPWYAGKFAGFRHARPEELTSQYKDANVLESAPVIDPVVYLPWLEAQVLAAGGKFEQRAVKQLSDCPAEFTVIINCAGLGARALASDDKLVPERVQVVTIKPNGFDQVVIDDDGPNKRACIVPHADYIKVGAYFDGNHETLQVDDDVTKDILERCRKMVPGFKADPEDVLSVARALRPERFLTRVELDLQALADGRKVVHNYGHDGMGYLTSWGIAAEIAGYLA